jgi:hypothetical protein
MQNLWVSLALSLSSPVSAPTKAKTSPGKKTEKQRLNQKNMLVSFFHTEKHIKSFLSLESWDKTCQGKKMKVQRGGFKWLFFFFFYVKFRK